MSREELELLARYDGRQRVAALESAAWITLAPSQAADDPVAVTIQWSPGVVERPLPGSALWRAVLRRRLEVAAEGGVESAVVRSQIRRSLERFPDLESWWHWIRTGWTTPPSAPAP